MPKKLPKPGWSHDWKVDEIIECLTLGGPNWASEEGQAQRKKVEDALLKAMPNAYAKHPDDPDGATGKNEWPEADSHKDRKLATIWHRLEGDVQQIILDAYNAENP